MTIMLWHSGEIWHGRSKSADAPEIPNASNHTLRSAIFITFGKKPSWLKWCAAASFRTVGSLILASAAIAGSPLADAFETGGANDITAVSGRTSRDYVRARLANGSFAPESYAFGKGGNWAGAKVDASIDKLNFLDVAHMIAGPLASQNYVPSKDPMTAKL